MKNTRTSFTNSCLCLSLLLVGQASAFAQRMAAIPSSPLLPSPDSLERPFAGNYLGVLSRLRPARARYAASPLWRSAYFEDLGTWESFVGDDAAALSDFDAAHDAPHAPLPGSALSLHGYRPVDARRAILSLARTHRVIFINEAHHVPMDRAFTLSLLQGLYQRGFRYFAAETLNVKDSDLQARGYPTLATGYYTRDPIYGDLIRTALQLGYKVLPYESPPTVSLQTASDPLAQENGRERGQAQNVYDRVLKHDPQAKILVHAGYGHISKQVMAVDWRAGQAGLKKNVTGRLVPMAVWFHRISGIDPLCIDQTAMQEHSARAYENAQYQAVTAQNLLSDTPMVLRNAEGNDYVVPSERGGYDVMVFHPRTAYRFGRPVWLSIYGLRRPCRLPSDLPIPSSATAVLVQAFCENEPPAQAIPIDQVEISAGGRPWPALMLPSGKFLVRMVEASGTVLRQWHITMAVPTKINP